MERGLRNTNRSRDHRLRFTIWSFAVGVMLVALLVGAAVAYVHYSLVLYSTRLDLEDAKVGELMQPDSEALFALRGKIVLVYTVSCLPTRLFPITVETAERYLPGFYGSDGFAILLKPGVFADGVRRGLPKDGYPTAISQYIRPQDVVLVIMTDAANVTVAATSEDVADALGSIDTLFASREKLMGTSGG
jgi:hypothetical protein